MRGKSPYTPTENHQTRSKTVPRTPVTAGQSLTQTHLPASENDFFLDSGNVFKGDLGAEVAARHHDDVRHVDDLRQRGDAVVGLHLGDDIDGVAGVLGLQLRIDVGTHVGDDVGVPDEGDRDKVHLHACAQSMHARSRKGEGVNAWPNIFQTPLHGIAAPSQKALPAATAALV